MENEAPGFERRSVRLNFWGVLWKVQQESVFNDVSVFFHWCLKGDLMVCNDALMMISWWLRVI